MNIASLYVESLRIQAGSPADCSPPSHTFHWAMKGSTPALLGGTTEVRILQIECICYILLILSIWRCRDWAAAAVDALRDGTYKDRHRGRLQAGGDKGRRVVLHALVQGSPHLDGTQCLHVATANRMAMTNRLWHNGSSWSPKCAQQQL